MAALAEKDSLNQRVRDVLLFDTYGQRLTEKQRMACDMILMRDFSLAEAAESLGVSRQGVHDLVARAREHMEDCESSFGLVSMRNRLEAMRRALDENKSRLPEDFYRDFMKLLEG
ncbi:sigma factor-like helix-turn-helix DNA-binding protein [Cloacibacillus sp. An23]|uniref:sigma factor-like helix-turn-helix DNA-binding protein n=1 Tax=Cloacibacillus sp. An23 TaxID=1965591 RepID=UPI002100DF1F|nr:sigma factor-like helix-turn-helix DNA-binding protein [Cloacibacillus sp. An23]